MSRNGDVEQENAPTAESSTRTRRRGDPFLIACKGFSLVTSLAAILCIVANALSAVLSFKHGSDFFDGIFRCYAVLIACFVVLAETEWSFIMRFSKVLEYWAGRGMLQIFVAVMTRAFPDYFGERRDLVLFQSIASYLLLACGLIYVVSVRSLNRENQEWSPMHWFSETRSPEAADLKRASSKGFRGVGTAQRGT
ncbi:uncharacterized protein LOC107631067 isoform X1 [Arachis ipaensis]|uniref:uncharacterized protein LOC107631067 isoform X1 n=1 Tax=Arachis ipaensis TaxID=130454 RepID=UPI0007AEEFE4|nr:uncharacterized protein LOC107631067 isoform X1 [Arachis ipaensis]XP_025638086.1 uncharacterized protein LOC112733367 isoform X1 [Arachis hypogaea]QHO02655.1 uncharacterized protein DS421_13g425610 [Arachis hypogaea]